ncbi:GNAT family N-acetyltransferase [Mycobacterium persicum]|uniref:GNAT family N-acetyltransferase n=2 Tax=Mycobacterium persicum TaxID=1487726 RepID=A0A8E2LSP1_9MYCO|nr:acetyltransferase [Mycobacterium persicum]ORB49799.1 GNAT family N-acetyltransferase [Mycobacterium persicum]ORB92428.1 GNAT family N-acetyltransferase [Mycobacterium persicum]ORB97827.1 GNAT family N-acetyltransferase [Mycobacterium persicum]ORC04478.1 GNAT family N-acetyltransferase [Mycobacterium persicum]
MTEMPDGISIRRAKPADYANVAPMHYRSWRLSYRGIVIPELLDLFDWRAWIGREYPLALSRAGWGMWLAESSGHIVGVSIFGPEPGNPDHLEIDALYVAAGHERRGIGSLLLDHALSSEPSHDAVLWCAEMNHQAQCFYRKKGFRPDGRSDLLTLLPGVLAVPQIGFTLHRSTGQG